MAATKRSWPEEQRNVCAYLVFAWANRAHSRAKISACVPIPYLLCRLLNVVGRPQSSFSYLHIRSIITRHGDRNPPTACLGMVSTASLIERYFLWVSPFLGLRGGRDTMNRLLSCFPFPSWQSAPPGRQCNGCQAGISKPENDERQPWGCEDITATQYTRNTSVRILPLEADVVTPHHGSQPWVHQ